MFQTEAVVVEVKTLADQSCRLKLETRELSPEAYAQLFSLSGREGHFAFSPTVVKDEDIVIPKEARRVREKKSPGERLRAVIYRWWENSQTSMDFESFYVQKMEMFIDIVKEKLPSV